MIKPGVWMASVDLHHAYYSVSIPAPHRPYLSFLWQGTYYHYLRHPNGYAQAPLIFTKLLWLPFGSLRSQSHLSVVYMDDSYLQGDSVSSCRRNGGGGGYGFSFHCWCPWKDTYDLLHVNVLELTAARLALETAWSTHIQLKLDNLMPLAYINKMDGTHSPECNHVTQQIWEWAIPQYIWLSAAYIPGNSNVVADFHSRCFHDNKE